MEGSPLSSRVRDEPELGSMEFDFRGRSCRQTNSSRRLSGSYIRSFREESNNRSFRSNVTNNTSISSTASSPGCHLKYEIDPSTYSFTTALKALQGKQGSVWECYSADGLALNSKWNEAERYISNPLSGQVPLECLSSNALGTRPLRGLVAARIAMSAPLVYSSRRFGNHSKPPMAAKEKEDERTLTKLAIKEKELLGGSTARDVGTQSNRPDHRLARTTSSLSSAIPPIQEGEPKDCEPEVIKHPNPKEVEEVKATKEEEDTKRGNNEGEQDKEEKKKKKKSGNATHMCGCILPWTSMWSRRRNKCRNISTLSSVLPVSS